ncbi:MAG: type III pantothenate kinase [Deltaproteobacteria bacterium]|nr:type III pantothenate kinase [Deltaproteobacteria bacterium]
MLIAIDIGNTNTVIGAFEGDTLKADWRIRTERDVTVDELGMLFRNLFDSQGLDFAQADEMIISCVVPPMLDAVVNFGRKYVRTEPLVVGPGIKTGIPILIDNPKEVGADRVVNVVAAYERYHRALIVVDLGTSTNFDYVSPKGEYVGGVIAPGLIISSEALFQKASKLQRIEISRPKRAIGRDTISAMLAGLVYGHVGLIDGVVRRMKTEAGTDPMVIASGGLAHLIAAESETIDEVIPDLTLDGLRIIFNLNRTPRDQN